MKNRASCYIFTFIIIILSISNGCNKDDNNNATTTPALTTSSVISITQTTAVCGGKITSDVGSSITARGVCWSTSTTPTISGSKTSDGEGYGTFKSTITGLIPNTTYFVRAYASNNAGTSYGNQLIFKTFTGTVKDIDNNVYNTITIGTQEWTTENLKVTHFTNGDPIPKVIENSGWNNLTSWAYCENYNSADSSLIYGHLYNFYAVASGALCPAGWHVPSDQEWITLLNYLGGDTVAGGKLKESGTSHWKSPNTGGSNETGFTGLPAGYRSYYQGFLYNRVLGYWWSSTEIYTFQSYYIGVNNYSKNVTHLFDYKGNGYSVRCIKDK